MVDAHDSKSCSERGVGSSPTSGTNKISRAFLLCRRAHKLLCVREGLEKLCVIYEKLRFE